MRNQRNQPDAAVANDKQAGMPNPENLVFIARLGGSPHAALATAGAELRRLVETATLPPGLEDDMIAAYRELGREYGREPAVAVRSSATAEDLPQARFAGQHESYLGVRGLPLGAIDLTKAYRAVLLVTARAGCGTVPTLERALEKNGLSSSMFNAAASQGTKGWFAASNGKRSSSQGAGS